MSQKNAKRIRRLECRMDAVEHSWENAEAEVRNRATIETVENAIAQRHRVREAERRADLWKRTAYAALVAGIIAELIAIMAIHVNAEDTLPVDPPVGATTAETASEAAVEPEQDENGRIVCALIDQAQVIEDCEVTWYTEDTCGKTPDDPAYGITRSGLPVVEHLTCAVDPNVIPLYSDVFVQYADGTVEQLWATDTGVYGEAVDIYTPDYDYAIQCGRQHLTVYWVAPGEVE